MAANLSTALQVIQNLQDAGVDPLLYGSLGASQYLGEFKTFSDVDLLVDESWVTNKWSDLQVIMEGLGYVLQDEHEHEFKNSAGTEVAFAATSVLTRDGVVLHDDDILHRELNGTSVKTLTPEAFLRAYQFSEKDGYRLESRGKKDAEVIALLENYLQAKDS